MYERRHANDLAGIVAALEPYRAELVGVVVESTYNWYWLVDGLMEAGYVVYLANTAAIKKYEGLKYSGDEADAAYLATLLRLGLLPEGYIYPRETRGARDLCRKWKSLLRLGFCRSGTLCIAQLPASEELAGPGEGSFDGIDRCRFL